MEEVGRPEKLMINRYVRLRSATRSIATALGFLVLFWSTVVLLAGFVDHLLPKDFWVLTALSFVLLFRMMEIFIMEILTELAFDDSFRKLDFNKLLKALVRIFHEEEANNTAGEEASDTVVDVANSTIVEVEQADRDKKATRMRRKAGEALARLLPVRVATDVNVADKLSKQEVIDLLTKVLDQILSSKMVKIADAVKRVVIEKKNLVIGVLNQILSSKIGKFSEASIRAARETKNLVIEEHNQILSSEIGTNAYAAKRYLTKIENLSTEVIYSITHWLYMWAILQKLTSQDLVVAAS